MDIQGQRDLQLLTEVERNPGASQRSLAKKLGVALGLTNLYLKRLARKGYIKVTTIPSNRIKYLVTPRGIAEKTRLTYEFMQYSMTFYRDMRAQLKRVLGELARTGAKRVVLCGIGELAELAYLSLREMDLTLVGIIGSEQEGGDFLSYPVWPVDSLTCQEFDAVLICKLAGILEIRQRLLAAGVPEQKIIAVADSSATGTWPVRS